MSDQLFEVAFSGQISAEANLDEVKARVGKMFNADEAKLAALFSGKRVVIKKNIDQATAAKYKTALNRAGAECEVAAMGDHPSAVPAAADESASPAESTGQNSAAVAAAVQIETSYEGEVPPPPKPIRSALPVTRSRSCRPQSRRSAANCWTIIISRKRRVSMSAGWKWLPSVPIWTRRRKNPTRRPRILPASPWLTSNG